MVREGNSGTISRLTNVRRGLPKGSTHAANSRFPTSCSRNLDVARPALRSCDMRMVYLVTFAGSRLHTLVREQYWRPSITIDVAGCNAARGCPAERVIDI